MHCKRRWLAAHNQDAPRVLVCPLPHPRRHAVNDTAEAGLRP